RARHSDAPGGAGPERSRDLVGIPSRSAQPVCRPPPGPRLAVRVRLLHGRNLSGAAVPDRSGPIPRELRAVGPQRDRDRGGAARREVIRSARLPLPAAMNIGLAFEIVSSYAIAAAEFADPMGLEMHGMMGLSWVAVWIVLFTVVVPTAPRRAVLAALASVSSVPVIIGLMIASGTTSLRLDPGQFFFGLVFPYLLVVGMAYVG